MTESCFATLKAERIDRQSWLAQQQVRAAVCAWTEVFPHRQRQHANLGYLSPAEFEARLTGGPIRYR